MKIKQTTQTKVGGRSNNLKLKAQSLKREFISRFQLLIIYMNFMQKTNKKVGEDNYGHPTAIMIGLVIFAVAAVWAVVLANGAGAAFSCDSNDGTTCTVSSPQTRGVDYPVLSLSGANRRSASQIYF